MRESAWHKLGWVKGDYITRQEIDDRGVTFPADVRQLSWNGEPIKAWGVFHSGNNTFIAHCGEHYAIHPASDLFDTTDEIIGSSNGSSYETAGVIGDYQKVFGLVNLGQHIRVGDDITQPYLAGVTSFDGSCSTRYDLTGTRIVCANTMKMFLSQKSQTALKVRHTKNSHRRLHDAKEALALIKNDCLSIQERLNFLAQRYVNPVNMKDLLNEVISQPVGTTKDKVQENRRRANILDEIIGIFESNDDNAFPEQRGTAYNLLNAVTNYVDHVRSTRTSDGEDPGVKRSISALFGDGDKMKTRAYDVIMQGAGTWAHKPYATTFITVPDMPETPILDSILSGNAA